MQSEQQLDEALSRPTAADVQALAKMAGDLLILGVSGKMGPSMAALARRACEQSGSSKRIFGAARFSDPAVRQAIEAQGVETIVCDLLDRAEVEGLPDCPNVLFMAGQKFGTAGGKQALTWATNTYAPAIAAERFRHSRIVAFSTGNVYPFTPVASGGPVESDPTGPVGEYAESALGRERMFEYFSQRYGTPVTILRLNYANELRYGVLHDIAERVFERRPIDLSMGYVNVIWQRDANSVALRAFGHCASPPLVVNLTGTEILAVRQLAERFGAVWGIEPIFEGSEKESALLNNARRCEQLFGPPEVSVEQMVEWIAAWVARGGRSLGKPTHYEERKGAF
jgi:nucleoside-diphosphate-sugar epimerase